MRLLVTGGTGYLGSELLRQAADATGVSTRDFDVRDEDGVRRAVQRHRPDVVIHTAYRQDTPEAWSINVDGSAVVARAASRAGARLIHMSTDVVFGGERGWCREEDPPSPVTAYGESKAAAERAVRDAHPEALIVRTSLLYGAATPSRHERMCFDPKVTFFTDELRCPTHVSDLAAALLELAAVGQTGILHVAAPDAVSRCEFARLIAGLRVRCARSTDLGVRRPLDCTLDSSRARELLRTRLRGVREVLARGEGSAAEDPPD